MEQHGNSFADLSDYVLHVSPVFTNVFEGLKISCLSLVCEISGPVKHSRILWLCNVTAGQVNNNNNNKQKNETD